MFAGKLNTVDSEINIDNGVNYGIIFDTRVEKEVIVELMYNRLDTKVQITEEPCDTVNNSFDMKVEYFQWGAQFETEDRMFQQFGAFTIGATLFYPTNEDINSEWRFSSTAGGGIKYYFIMNIGIRLQWRFLIPVYFSSGAVFCSNGRCGVVMSGSALLLQYDPIAGLVVVL